MEVSLPFHHLAARSSLENEAMSFATKCSMKPDEMLVMTWPTFQIVHEARSLFVLWRQRLLRCLLLCLLRLVLCAPEKGGEAEPAEQGLLGLSCRSAPRRAGG